MPNSNTNDRRADLDAGRPDNVGTFEARRSELGGNNQSHQRYAPGRSPYRRAQAPAKTKLVFFFNVRRFFRFAPKDDTCDDRIT